MLTLRLAFATSVELCVSMPSFVFASSPLAFVSLICPVTFLNFVFVPVGTSQRWKAEKQNVPVEVHPGSLTSPPLLDGDLRTVYFGLFPRLLILIPVSSPSCLDRAHYRLEIITTEHLAALIEGSLPP